MIWRLVRVLGEESEDETAKDGLEEGANEEWRIWWSRRPRLTSSLVVASVEWLALKLNCGCSQLFE